MKIGITEIAVFYVQTAVFIAESQPAVETFGKYKFEFEFFSYYTVKNIAGLLRYGKGAVFVFYRKIFLFCGYEPTCFVAAARNVGNAIGTVHGNIPNVFKFHVVSPVFYY